MFDHVCGFSAKVPDGPVSFVGLNPAFSTASHRARGDGAFCACGVTVTVDAFTSACAVPTPGTATTCLSTRLAQPSQCRSSTVIVVVTGVWAATTAPSASNSD